MIASRPFRLIERAARILADEGLAGFGDRVRQYATPMPPAPPPAQMLAFCRAQADARREVLFQPWHITRHRQRHDGAPGADLRAFAHADPVTLGCMHRGGRAVIPGRAPGPDLPPATVVTRTTGQRPALLAQAIASVLNQTAAGTEHVIVQDGGDSMGPFCARVAREYGARLWFIALPPSGRSRAANAGVDAARTPFVMFLDDDDLLFAHHVAVLAAALDKAPAAPAAYSLAWEVATDIDPQGNPAEVSYHRHRHQALPFSRRRLAVVNYLPIQSVLFRRAAFLDCGGVDACVDLLEDWDLWRRMASLGDFVKVPQVTSLYRVPADPTQALQRTGALRRTQQQMAAHNARAAR